MPKKRDAATLQPADDDEEVEGDDGSDDEVLPVQKIWKAPSKLGDKCDCSDPATGKIKRECNYKHVTSPKYFDPKYQERSPNYPKFCCYPKCHRHFTNQKKLYATDPDKYRLVTAKFGVYMCEDAETENNKYCMAAYCQGACYQESLQDDGATVPKRRTRGGGSR